MNKTDIQNLLVFLQRVQLTGAEAQELVRLQGVLTDMLKEDKEEKE